MINGKQIPRIIKYATGRGAPGILRQFIEDMWFYAEFGFYRCMCGDNQTANPEKGVRKSFGPVIDIFCKPCFLARLPMSLQRSLVYDKTYRKINADMPSIGYLKDFISGQYAVNEYLNGVRVQSPEQLKRSKVGYGKNHRLEGQHGRNLQNHIDAWREWIENNMPVVDRIYGSDIFYYFEELPRGKDNKWRLT